MDGFEGRHALVTGGGRGIGRAIAAALAGAGAKVTVAGRQDGPLKDAVAQGHAAAYAIADVTDAGAIDAAVKQAGPVDILIANAGIAESAPFAKTSPEQFRRIFDVNVMGVVHAIQAVLGGMVARRSGRIVAIASTAGLKGYSHVSAYTASKHAVVGLVRSLAIETAKSGVTVNAVCPSYTDTEMVRGDMEKIAQRSGRTPEEALSTILMGKPLGRLIKPEEVAAAVLYLCSPQAAAVTGTTLTVAGGEL